MNRNKKENPVAIGLLIGVALGASLGYVTGDSGLWISLGLIVGAGVGQVQAKKKSRSEE